MRSVVWRQRCYRRLLSACGVSGTPLPSQVWLRASTYPVSLDTAQQKTLGTVRNRRETDPSFLSSEVDSGLARPESTQEAILERANVHGIDSLERLAFEADLGPGRARGGRLLDDHHARQDLDLWGIILDYRNLKDGLHGVRQIVACMLHEVDPVILRSDGLSEHIWRTILPAVLNDQGLLLDICQGTAPIIRNRPLAFADVVGELLALGNLRLAIICGTQLLISHFRGREDLLHLFEVAYKVGTVQALNNYGELVSRLPLHRIYRDTVPKLWSSGRTQHAFILHRHLLALGDYPTDFEHVEHFVRWLAARNLSCEPFLRDLENHAVSFSHQARRIYALEKVNRIQRTGMEGPAVLLSGPGTRPVKLSDTFVARTFATRSVSFDFVLSGLRFIGLFEVGPLAVRELALSAEDFNELMRRFRKLEDMEVDLGASAYVRIVKNLCMAGESQLLQSVIDSDMHYEVFEDIQQQKQLLKEYCHKDLTTDINRTLAVLTGGERTMDAESRAARLMLQTDLVAGNWRDALTRLDNSRHDNNIQPQLSELAPLRFALRRIWTEVMAEARSNQLFLQRQPYLIGFMQFAKIAGLRIYPWQWRSMLYAVAQSSDWDMFRQQVISVARVMQNGSETTVGKRYGNLIGRKFALQDLVDESLQSLVIEVGLTAQTKNQDINDLWFRGIDLLQMLQRWFGVKVSLQRVNDAFKARLGDLFRGDDTDLQRQVKASLIESLHKAWRQGTVPTHESSLYATRQSRELRGFHRTALRLFQLRSRLVSHRRNSVEASELYRIMSGRLWSEDAEAWRTKHRETSVGSVANSWDASSKDQQDTVVYYEDLLHPSYGKTYGVQR